MAIHADLEELLKFMDPADAEVQRQLFEKSGKFAEEVRAGRLRQSDYDRFMNQAKVDIKAANDKVQVWDDWAKRNVPKHDELLKEVTHKDQQIIELEAQISAAAARAVAGGDGEMNQLQVEEAIKANLKQYEGRFISREDVNKIAVEEAKKIVAEQFDGSRKEFLEKTFPEALETVAVYTEVNFQNMQEFKKPLTKEDRVKISKLMTERNYSLNEAYEEYVKPQRESVAFEKRVEEETNKRMSKQGIPGVSAPAGEPGPLQIRLKEQQPLAGTSFDLGDGTASSAAAAELRGEGKF